MVQLWSSSTCLIYSLLLLFLHGTAVVVLSLLGVLSSLTVRSFADDSYNTGNPDHVYPVSYITYWTNDNNQVRFLKDNCGTGFSWNKND